MKITLLCIGKTDESFIKEGIDKYFKRLKYYVPFHILVLPDIKTTKSVTQLELRKKEGEMIFKNISNTDYVVLLDERGKQYRSVELAKYIQVLMNNSIQHIVFLIGGPYGFDEKVKLRANATISLSNLTFSHQMVRLFFVEQVYRSFTILRGEPYHHE